MVLNFFILGTRYIFIKLQEIGKDLLLEVLPSLLNNELKGTIQDESLVTFAPNIQREEEKINFNKKAIEVHNLIRGLSLTPGAYCYLEEKQLKIYRSRLSELENDDLVPGSLKIENKNRLFVKCFDGYIELIEIQPEGKQKMDVKSFLNGCNKDNLIRQILK